MTLEKLRAALAAVLVDVVALAAVASASCARERVRHDDTFVAARHLGESTASPGADPDRPVAPSIGAREVSVPISRLPAGSAPAPAAPPSRAPASAAPPSARPPPVNTRSPGVFAPPPKP